MTGKPWRPSIHEEVKADMDRRDEELRERLGLAKDRSLRVDRAARPMSQADWAEASDDREYVRVAEDAVGDVRISTVWIGIDDRFIDDGQGPQIFETMVLGHTGEDLQRRYATEEDALIGHRQMVAAVRAKLVGQGGRSVGEK